MPTPLTELQALVVPGGQLKGGRYFRVCQLALQLLTASRQQQREISRAIVEELDEQRRWGSAIGS